MSRDDRHGPPPGGRPRGPRPARPGRAGPGGPRNDDRRGPPKGARPDRPGSDRPDRAGGDTSRGDRPRGKPGARPDGKGDDFRRPERTDPGLASRGAALDILRRIRGGTPLDEAVATTDSFLALEGPDRGFAYNLVTAVLRRQNSLDLLFEPFLRTPLKPNQHEVRAILRLAAAQIVILKTPAHAAASTAVELAKERRDTNGFRGLINALCRRIAGLPEDKLESFPVRTDTPGWLWRAIERAYGAKAARAIALQHRVAPPLDITVADLSEREALAERLGGSPVGPETIRLADAKNLTEREGFAEGAFWVQDVAATLPARLLDADAGIRVLDLCAAPGGKTLQLARSGAAVTALDISRRRTERLTENLERTGLSADVVTEDIFEWSPDAPFEAVLLDAPCTATGTIRRNPDLPWAKGEHEAASLADLQDRMMDRAAEFVAPGGALVFATCSLLPVEGEERIAAFLERRADFALEPVMPEEVGGLDVIDREGRIRCLPHKLSEGGGMDGFFAARVRRNV